MIQAYAAGEGTLTPIKLTPGAPLPEGLLWLDLPEPTAEEDKFVEALTGVGIPTRDEMRDIEESSRLYSENGALYLTTPVLYSAGTDSPGIAPVTFVVTSRYLITVRYTSPQPFQMYAARASRHGNDLVVKDCEPLSVLFGLIESITDRIAEHLENASQRLDEESRRLTPGATAGKPISTEDFRLGLRTIGKEGDFLSKVRESLAGLGRLLSYVAANAGAEKGKNFNRAWLNSLEGDVDSLNSHVSFLSDRTVFLLDMVVGMVSVEQNAIIKIFSVAAVVFMPPTLVASIYGMNFERMPELKWMLGYPFAIGLMVVSAIIPLIYFRFRRWL